MSRELALPSQPGEIATIMTKELFEQTRAQGLAVAPDGLAIQAIARRMGLLKKGESLPATFLLLRADWPKGRPDVTHPTHITRGGEVVELEEYYALGALSEEDPRPVPLGWRTQAARRIGVDHYTVVTIPGWAAEQRRRRIGNVAFGLAGDHLPIELTEEPTRAEQIVRAGQDVAERVVRGKGAMTVVLTMGGDTLLSFGLPDPFTVTPQGGQLLPPPR